MSVKKRRRALLIVFVCLVSCLLFGSISWHYLTTRHHLLPSGILAHVVRLERAEPDERSLQLWGTYLAILGREDEVRKTDFFPGFEQPASQIDAERLKMQIVPWHDGIQEIAAEHRIVMIMEDHLVPEHREWIGGVLETFRESGFTHYAAEALGESGVSLQNRGYPTIQTGFYTSEPKFGNLIRRALDLEFEILGYDYRPFTLKIREEFAANELAQVIHNSSGSKLLVHAGPAHLLKHETEQGFRWLAARLWDKTNCEPFTIWQWSDLYGANDYRRVHQLLEERGLGDFEEPVLLMPPLDGLAPVDAILIYPRDQGTAPAARSVVFPNSMRMVSGSWTAETWPVVICAYHQNEPVNAIPLDQIMLRNTENKFVLWIPPGMEYDIRVFDDSGQRASTVDYEGHQITVGLTNQALRNTLHRSQD